MLFDKDDLDTQKLPDRSLSQESENIFRNFEENDMKISEQEIEIVELVQTQLSHKNSDSHNSLVSNNNDYWQSLKTIMRSKVM